MIKGTAALKLEEREDLEELGQNKAKLDDPELPKFKTRNEPKPEVKPIEQFVNITKLDIGYLNDYENQEGLPLLSYSPHENVKPFIPQVIKTCFKHKFALLFIIITTVLGCLDVYQVEKTRAMTDNYSDTLERIENLNMTYLSLLSEKEQLTELNLVHQAAVEKLDMVQAKTEDEILIDLR